MASGVLSKGHIAWCQTSNGDLILLGNRKPIVWNLINATLGCYLVLITEFRMRDFFILALLTVIGVQNNLLYKRLVLFLIDL